MKPDEHPKLHPLNLRESRVILRKGENESKKHINLLKEIAHDKFGSDRRIVIGVNGSVARREMTSSSDVDLFFLVSDFDLSKKIAKQMQQLYINALQSEGIKMPAQGGVFEKPIRYSRLVSNIGGEKDTNIYITRRMLYLLESECVFNQEKYETLRLELIKRYVSRDLKNEKICLFLLNDVVRYWRTICIDFEHKTADGDKPRAIRLIKLRFSRMLLYFAGVAAISRAVYMSPKNKRKKLAKLFAIPPVKRLEVIFGRNRCACALSIYATFLDRIDKSDYREKLEMPGSKGLDTDQFEELEKLARDFKETLLDLLGISCDSTSTIIKSLLL